MSTLFPEYDIYPYPFSKSRVKIIVINLSGGKKRMSDYNEEAYENALVELFQNMGWEHVYEPEIERDWHSPLYDSVLEDSIRRINPGAAPAAIDEALLKLRNFENAELKKKNAVFMEYLQNGIEVSYHENGENKSAIIYIADFDEADNTISYSINENYGNLKVAEPSSSYGK